MRSGLLIAMVTILVGSCLAPTAAADPVDDVQALHDHFQEFYEKEIEAWIDCIDGCFPSGCMMNPLPGGSDIC